VVDGGAFTSSPNQRWLLGSSPRMHAVAPTVPMRVRVPISGSGTPASTRKRPWATLGKYSGQVARGTSMISVPNSRRCWSCHAVIAGPRNRVRGDT
jgi:hypothetical protein